MAVNGRLGGGVARELSPRKKAPIANRGRVATPKEYTNSELFCQEVKWGRLKKNGKRNYCEWPKK